MAKEWYLMNTNNDTVSGFESDSFDDFATDAFGEALSSSLGSDVEICNFDLSVRTPVRVIINENVQDTQLKTTRRTILAPIGTCKAGQYMYYKNLYWLIVGLVDNNGLYEKAVLVLCNYLLTWENEAGKIVQRWANITSASQYNNGETSTKFYFVRSDQLMILIPDDEECLLIEHKKRFIIDRRCEIYERNFEKDVISDTSKSLMVYELTRSDNVLYDYQDSGYYQFMACQDEQRNTDGYYLVNGKGYWLCGKPSVINKTEVLSCSIECDEPDIYCGLEPTVYYAKFLDSNGNETTILPQWEINCDFNDSLNIEYIENSISISADDNKLINKSFGLSLCADGYEKATIIVTIKAFI